MRQYLFFALLALAAFISWKWQLMNPETGRLKDSNEENRVGYALLGFVFIAMMFVLFSGSLLDRLAAAVFTAR